ncbi:GTPase activating protein (SH3 domain) binding protein [Phytophthora pseudosyringae]|uniref:GTPase activating protein (SH3 domain) binding protein n=1 Tax=Phytophthora pseudosyringae TaxID=221518 RepID=A0A8T1VZU3_9STRA|nr:GTPase activating protein (SH3 domain) binding protein [Phytophthora pseudosyringae]
MPETLAPAAHEDETAPSPSTVGNTFMRQYYHFLAKEPQSLHRFYKAESRWCHGLGSHMEEPIAGQRAINEQILKRGYAGARVDLDAGSIDCQSSLGGGVLVLVTGVMTLRGSPTPKPFVQTFFLAVQPKGFFVLNDCLRFLELPGASPVDAALDAAAKNGRKTQTQTPTSPVKEKTKGQDEQEETPVPASPKKAASPVKAPTKTTKKVVKEAAAPASPVKATATVASSPVKKTTTTTTTTTTAKPKEEKEAPAAPPVKTPSPVKSPAKSPAKKQDKAPAAASPAPAAAPVAAPADPVVPAPAEPEKPKTWAALFSASKAAAAITPSAAAAAPASAPAKPATPKAAAAPVSAPAPAAIAPDTSAPAPEKSPKNKAGNGKEKEHKRLYSLFIRDVPSQTRENDLRELFKGYGSIAGVSVVAQRGFAFVDYHEQESMRTALAETNEFKVFDKVLQVDERAERKEGQRGGFRGNDSRGRGRGHGPKGGRGERKERNGDDAPASNKGERREAPRREKTGNRRGGKVDAASTNRAE